VIHQQKGDVPKARSAYEKIIAIEPKFVPAANNLAYIYSETGGDMDKALKLAQMAKEGAPEDPQIADTLGWILYKMGNYDWALGYLKESASKLADNAEVQYHLGMTQYKLGNAEEAKRALEAALTLGGDFQGAEEVRRALSEL
jgi:Flp pilus assembly protein TadD